MTSKTGGALSKILNLLQSKSLSAEADASSSTHGAIQHDERSSFFADPLSFGLNSPDGWISRLPDTLFYLTVLEGKFIRLHCGFRVRNKTDPMQQAIDYSLYVSRDAPGFVIFIPLANAEMSEKACAWRYPTVQVNFLWQKLQTDNLFGFGVDASYRRYGLVPDDVFLISEESDETNVYVFKKLLLLPGLNDLSIAQECQMCGKRAAKGEAFRVCGNCEWAFYCSRKCQVAAWNHIHKSICQLLREARLETNAHVCLMSPTPPPFLTADKKYCMAGFCSTDLTNGGDEPEFTKLVQDIMDARSVEQEDAEPDTTPLEVLD